ncbi:hypothetical protein V6N13_130154 [Hibiscus sabdariffa]|uniref:Uncharacterized protein n=2 Tax=Hibiscus sabdariffa TaxID=183260 RepID=A0ABR2SNC8_9ROSI
MARGAGRPPLAQEFVSESNTSLVGVDGMRNPASDSLRNHGELLSKKGEQAQVASTGAICRARSSLKATNHVAVHISDGGHDGVVAKYGEPSFSGPIRKVATKGAHRFNPKTYLRQRYSVVKKSVKKGPDLETGTGDVSCALGEVEGLEGLKETQVLGQDGLSDVVVLSP